MAALKGGRTFVYTTLLSAVLLCLITMVTSAITDDDICKKCTCKVKKPISDSTTNRLYATKTPMSVTCKGKKYLVNNPLPIIEPTNISIVQLTLSNFNITMLKASYWLGMPHLRHLKLSRNNILEIESGALKKLSLDLLDLSNNPIKNLNKQRVEYNRLNLKIARVDHLLLCNMSFTWPDNNSISKRFWPANLLKLKSLDLSRNKLLRIESNAFKNFTRLETLNIGFTWLENLGEGAFKGLVNLTRLIMPSNAWLFKFPSFHTTDVDNITLMDCFTPSLKFINISRTGISRIDRREFFNCLGKLEHFEAEYTGIWILTDYTFIHAKSLRILNLHSSRLRLIEEFAFAGTKIDKLDIGSNMYTFQQVSNTTKFWPLEHLKELNIENNNFNSSSVPNDYFESSPNLEVLIMNDLSTFQGFRANSLRGLTKLGIISIDRLNLNEPNWKVLNETNVSVLSMQGNQITHINPGQIKLSYPLLFNRLRKFDLSQVKFACDCDNLALQEWICVDKKVVFPHKELYKCTDNKRLFCDYRISNCDTNGRSQVVTTLITVTLVIFISIPTTVFLAWKYRYRIKYFIVKHRAIYNRPRQRAQYEFVPSLGELIWYAKTDVMFVMNHLQPLFENDLNVRLRIKDRDFYTGDEWQEVIDCIESSRRVILVVSNSFCRENFAIYVVDQLKNKIVDGIVDEHPICILKEEIHERNLSKNSGLAWLIKKEENCIKWPDEITTNSMKWVRSEIRRRLISNVHDTNVNVAEQII